MLDLAFDPATWHSYAKLRKHTEYSLRSLRSQSKELGRQLCVFLRETCSQYKTKRLPGEEAARGHCRVAKAKKGSSTGRRKQGPRTKPATEGDSDLRPFNLATYKIHALADYADHIERFGPTDCFTTQHVCCLSYFLQTLFSQNLQGELEHRRVKRFYRRTNKIQFPRQIAKQERFQRHFRKYIATLREKTGAKEPSGQRRSTQAGEDRSPSRHYSTSVRERDHLDLYQWAFGEHGNDPALKVCFSTSGSFAMCHLLPTTGLCPKPQGPPPCSHPLPSVRGEPSHLYRG